MTRTHDWVETLIRSYRVIVRHMIDDGGIDFRFEQLVMCDVL